MRLIVFICALFLIPAAPALAQPTPVRVGLTPSAVNGEIDRLGVELRFSTLPVAAGEALLRMPTLIVGTPTAAYDADDIAASDASGPLPIEPTPTGNYRRYVISRATRGPLAVARAMARR